jgi:hypothetical protein
VLIADREENTDGKDTFDLGRGVPEISRSTSNGSGECDPRISRVLYRKRGRVKRGLGGKEERKMMKKQYDFKRGEEYVAYLLGIAEGIEIEKSAEWERKNRREENGKHRKKAN